MPLAAVVLAFDPIVRVGDFAFRLETAAIAAGILVALLVAALLARRQPAGADGSPLRPDDLRVVVLAAIPGAVVGGRVGYVLSRLDYYLANPGAILDPAQGSLELSLAVAGGALTGTVAAAIVSEAAGRWLHVAAVPTLLAIGIGKTAMALGGSGQGAPATLPWATSYAGPGPWGSLAPVVASHPSQLYEAALVALVAIVLVGAGAAGAFRHADGLAWFAGVGAWALGRVGVAATWRDGLRVGPVLVEQLLAIGLALACVAAAGAVLGARVRDQRRHAGAEPAWPDPATRPRF